MEHIRQDTFIEIAKANDFDLDAIYKDIHEHYNPKLEKHKIKARLARYRIKGYLPLDSGNTVSVGEILKGTSTLYDADGNIVLQWVKSDAEKEQFLASFQSVISDLAMSIPAIATIIEPIHATYEQLATLYISNDVHLGLLAWDKESGTDYNLEGAVIQLRAAYDYLFETTPNSRIGIVVDLGDLLEADNQKNVTPKSGNVLSVDSRYPKVLRAAYEALIYAVGKALTKHEIVYFYNIEGNHDLTSGHAIREIIRMAFRDNPRVIVDESPRPIKYHQHGQVLLQFAHGDGMKMKQAGEVMAHDCQAIFSQTRYRYAHLGHIHQDSVYDGPICRVESHRNLAPLNAWAFQMGYRSSPGTMKAITYHCERGEISRNLFTL